MRKNKEHHKMSLLARMNHWRIKATLATTCAKAEPKWLFTEVKERMHYMDKGFFRFIT